MLNGELRVTSGKLKWQWSCNVFLSWWFQPILKTLVKLDYFPRVGVKNGENKPYLKPPPGFPLNLGTFHCQEFTAGKICGTFLLKQSWLCMSGETPKETAFLDQSSLTYSCTHRISASPGENLGTKISGAQKKSSNAFKTPRGSCSETEGFPLRCKRKYSTKYIPKQGAQV